MRATNSKPTQLHMNQPAYRQFCNTVADLPVFAQDWYLDAVCSEGVWDAAVVSENGTIAGVLPYFLKQRYGFRYITMPPFVKHLGPFLAPEWRVLKHEHRLYAELIAQLPKIHGFIQDFHPSVANWLPFHWSGYRQTTRYVYQLDIRDMDRVRAGINRNMRRNIQKAEDLLTVNHDGSLEEVYRLNRLSFDRKNLGLPYSFEQFRVHDEALAAHQARYLFFARDPQGRIHSAAYLIRDRHTAYYHICGDDPALRQSGSGILLIWRAIQFAAEVLQVAVFDFEGSMLPEVEAIRRQFGAHQTPYFRIWKYNSPLFKLLDRFRS